MALHSLCLSTHTPSVTGQDYWTTYMYNRRIDMVTDTRHAAVPQRTLNTHWAIVDFLFDIIYSFNSADTNTCIYKGKPAEMGKGATG